MNAHGTRHRFAAASGIVCGLAAAVLVVSGCGASFEPWAGTVASPKRTTAAEHLVRRGDTLYAIAWVHGLDYRRLAQWNGIKPPRYLIYPGQRLSLRPSAGSAASAPEPAQAKPRAKAPATGWRWPLDDVRPRLVSAGRGGGLAICGTEGQAVRAAAAGKVVYSGFGLRHYGALVIIKHSGDFFSAYGRNGELLVKEGDAVKPGQPIARLRHGAHTACGDKSLYFEIRHHARTVNPMRYLPALQSVSLQVNRPGFAEDCFVRVKPSRTMALAYLLEGTRKQ